MQRPPGTVEVLSDRGFALRGPADAEQVAQGVVRTGLSPLVVEACPSRGDEVAAALDEPPDARTLSVRQRGQVGQDENRQRTAVAVDMIDVHGEIRDSRADQGVRHPAVGQVHEHARVVAAVEVGVPLRPDDPDGRHGPTIDQVLLVLRVPAVQRLDGAELATVFLAGPDVVPPGLDAAGETLEDPQASLRLRLARAAEGRPARLVHRHALGGELLPAQQSVHLLAGVAVLLEAGRVLPRLVVEHQDLRAAADRRAIAEPARLGRDASAVHADPEAVRPARLARRAIVQIPDLQATVVVPEDPLAVQRIVPVLPSRDGLAGAVAKPALTVRSNRGSPGPVRSSYCR